MSKWNLICTRNMLKAQRTGDWVSYFYWKEMFV